MWELKCKTVKYGIVESDWVVSLCLQNVYEHCWNTLHDHFAWLKIALQGAGRQWKPAPGIAQLPAPLYCHTRSFACTKKAQLESAALSMLQAGKLKVRDIIICFRTWTVSGQEWDLRALSASSLLWLLHDVEFLSFIKNNLVYNLCFMIQLFCSQQLITIKAGWHQISGGRWKRPLQLWDAPCEGQLDWGNEGYLVKGLLFLERSSPLWDHCAKPWTAWSSYCANPTHGFCPARNTGGSSPWIWRCAGPKVQM